MGCCKGDAEGQTYNVGLKKDLTNKLKTLEQEHVELNDPQILQKINETKQELNTACDNQVDLKFK